MCDWEDESISGHITVDGLPIWYEKFGSGPKPLLLIPGAIGQLVRGERESGS